MAGKTILTPGQRAALFDPPTDLSDIERLYTLGSEELAEIFRRRRPANRIGFAVQLCYLREPGRALRVDEMPPIAMLALLAEQLACTVNDFSLYADRSPTLREHRAQAEAWLGMRPFQIPDKRTLFDIAINVAASTDRGEAIVMEMVRAMRENNVTLPASDTFERIALVARARARKSAYAGIARGLSAQQKDNLAGLLGTGTVPGRTTLTWLREYPESPSAGNLAAVIDRLEVARGLAIEPDRARTIHANRYAVMAREAAIMSAQHLSRLDDVRRTATLCAFAIEMEVALTDAAVFMMEKMIGSMFRRAERTRSERLIQEAGRLKEIGKVYAALGRLLIEGRWKPEDPRDAIDREIGWPIIERSVHETELLTSGGEDGLEDVLERYPMVRRFAPPFLAAFTFRAAKPGDPVLAAIAVLNDMYSSNRRTLPPNVPLGFLRVRWRKLVLKDGIVDRRAYEIAVVVHLRERLASGAIWVEGSRAYRTLSDYLLPKPTFEEMLADRKVPVAVDVTFAAWLDERRQRLNARMAEVNQKALNGELPDAVLDDSGLKISPLRNAVPDDAENLKAQLYSLLPRIRITDLLAEVAVWTGFGDRFTHVRSGDPPSDSAALMAAILADATNLGLARMAESSQGLTHARLIWTAQWHIRDESYAAALASIVDYHHVLPHSAIWGPGTGSSSDGQFYRAGAKGEARADYNAKYGSDSGVLFYTHVSDRYIPFHNKVIAANAGEAAYVIDGLLDHESQLDIKEHATDTAGAVDHVFGLCHLLGFRFAPRIRDLNERRLYTLSPAAEYAALNQLIGGAINVKAIEDDWKEALHLAASIRTGTVSASVMLKKLAGYPRQNSLSRALREIGRVERSIFMLDWLDDIDLRRRTNANLNKGEARNALARAVFFNRLGELRDRTFENQRHRASGLNLVSAAIILWNTVYLGRAAAHLRNQGRDIDDMLLSHAAPLGWEHISLTGDYLWSDMKLPEDGFRPLRTQNRQSEA